MTSGMTAEVNTCIALLGIALHHNADVRSDHVTTELHVQQIGITGMLRTIKGRDLYISFFRQCPLMPLMSPKHMENSLLD